MINYRLKDSVVTHFPAIFKGLGAKGSVIHMALDGGVLAVRVAGGRPVDCGRLAEAIPPKVMPSVSSKNATEAVTLRSVAQLAAREDGASSGVPNKAKANPPSTDVTNANCR